MPIFKVTGPGGGKRSLVNAESLQEIISLACNKLALPSNASYQVFLEEDGTEIDDYEILQSLLELYPSGPVRLMILPNGVQWQPLPKRVPLNSIAFEQCQEGRQESDTFLPISTNTRNQKTVDEMMSPRASSPRDLDQLLPLPWEQIVPKNFKNSATNPVHLTLDLIRNVADYLKNIVKDTRFGTAGHVAKEVVSKFPKTFEQTVWAGENTVYSDGVKELKQRIYDRLRYLKDLDANTENKKKAEAEDSDDNSPQISKPDRYNKGQDSYGCVAYEPSLQEGESQLTQQMKKQQLLLDFTGEQILGEEVVARLLSETYPSQRICLNRREQENLTLADILNVHWPHLKKKSHYLTHASTLIGRDVANEWMENVERKVPFIFEYFRHYNKKNKHKRNAPKIITPINAEFKKVKEACEALKSNLPRTLAIFPLLSCYFEEKDLFILVEPAATDQDVIRAGDSAYHILVIKGMSLYDETIECFVVIEENTVAQAESFIEGVLLFVLSHFVYGYNYGPQQSLTLEFIQRMLLNINPPKGHKRGRKTKTGKLAINTAPVKLMNKIIKFKQSLED